MATFPVSPFEAIVLVAVTYRITRLITTDTLLEPVRDRLERAAVDHADTWPGRIADFAGRLMSCLYCAGFWVAVAATWSFVLAAGRWNADDLWPILLLPWAIAGAAALVCVADYRLTGD